MLPINFFFEDIQYRIRKLKLLRYWINKSVELENSTIEEITYIFCSDNYLHKLNIEYLEHDTFTDIITFQYNEENSALHSDIFVSIDRIKENSKLYNQRLLDEFHRIMIHGVLHLLGYKDKTPEEKQEMTDKENYYLSLRPNKLLKY
jgi:rRNA maturation RNase YbeY